MVAWISICGRTGAWATSDGSVAAATCRDDSMHFQHCSGQGLGAPWRRAHGDAVEHWGSQRTICTMAEV